MILQGDDDHTLADGASWFTVGPYSVRIKLKDNGALMVMVFEAGAEFNEPLADCEAVL